MIHKYNEEPRNLRLSRNIAKTIKGRRIRLGAYGIEKKNTKKSWLGRLKKERKTTEDSSNIRQ
jgi:hypothetical protein